ncbi:hypothetical protein ACWEU6_21735 [Streptosporangium sandarakinum]
MIPTTRELRRCNDCGDPVLWTVTRAGRHLLVNARPDDRGNQACYRISPRTWQSRSLDAADALPLAAWEHPFMPHIATCKGRATPAPAVLPPNVVRLDTKRRRR